MRTSKRAIQALKSTWLKTSGMAVISPRAVAKSAKPMSRPWSSGLDPPLPISLNTKIMLTTVPSNPTMVAILAMARMGASKKFKSGIISSSMTLAMERRMAASPCLELSSPATKRRRGM